MWCIAYVRSLRFNSFNRNCSCSQVNKTPITCLCHSAINQCESTRGILWLAVVYNRIPICVLGCSSWLLRRVATGRIFVNGRTDVISGLRQGFVGAAAVVGRAVREDEVDDHADNRKEEDDETPEELLAGRAVGLEDFDCSRNGHVSNWRLTELLWSGARIKERNVLKTMMSRIRTMKPTIPPPVPYCMGVPVVVIVSSARGAAKVRAARQSWRNRENIALAMLTAGIQNEQCI